jgi:N6-adenosine-specific RNA methylase IME4
MMGVVVMPTRQKWADRIARAWLISLGAIIETGRLLVEAKEGPDRLRHGEFIAMVNADLPFGRRTASMLMAVARDPRITNGNHGSHLPISWRTLYELTKLSDDDFNAKLIDGTINPEMERKDVAHTLKEQEREARRVANRAKIANLTGDVIPLDVKFPTIVIDPPWDWGDEGDVDQLGRAKPDYATMTIEQLMDFTMVPDHADVDCHLYLCITNRSLPKGFALLERWGFRYVTMLTWVKPSFGMGNYFRGQTEQILFGVKGSQLLKRKDVGTAFHWERGTGGHSSKPSEMFEMIESVSPGPYFEIFSRSERPDWTSWGENSRAAAA